MYSNKVRDLRVVDKSSLHDSDVIDMNLQRIVSHQPSVHRRDLTVPKASEIMKNKTIRGSPIKGSKSLKQKVIFEAELPKDNSPWLNQESSRSIKNRLNTVKVFPSKTIQNAVSRDPVDSLPASQVQHKSPYEEMMQESDMKSLKSIGSLALSQGRRSAVGLNRKAMTPSKGFKASIHQSSFKIINE